MTFTEKAMNAKISDFLHMERDRKILKNSECDEIIGLMGTPEPSSGAVKKALAGQIGSLIAASGLKRHIAATGKAATIDSLRQLIIVFAVLFSVAALIPVLYIQREHTWIVPFLLFCPLVHFLAGRLARDPDVGWRTVRNMHLFAAAASVVPLVALAKYLEPHLRGGVDSRHVTAATAGAWLAYTLLVSLWIRTESAFYCSLFIAGGVLNAALLVGFHDYPGCCGLNLLFASLLLLLAEKARKGGLSLSPGRLRATAVFFMCLAFATISVAIARNSGSMPPRVFSCAPFLFPAALIALPFVLRGEKAGMENEPLKKIYLVLLGITWLALGGILFILSLSHAVGVGSDVKRDLVRYVSPLCLLVLVFSWSVWFLYRQITGDGPFSLDAFQGLSMIMVLCLGCMYFVLSFRIGFLAGFLFAAACLYFTRKLQKRFGSLTAELREKERAVVEENAANPQLPPVFREGAGPF